MDESERQREIEEVQSLRRMIRGRAEASRNTPVRRLSPEAHEDALATSKDVWKEAITLLGGKDLSYVKDESGKALLELTRNNKPEKPGVDLTIKRYTVVHDPEDPKVQHTTSEIFDFSPTIVVKTTARSSKRVLKSGLQESLRTGKKVGDEVEYLPPKGLAIEKEEANKDQLGELLQLLKDNPPKE